MIIHLEREGLQDENVERRKSKLPPVKLKEIFDKPINFSSSEEYEKWKRKKDKIQEELEKEKNPQLVIFKFYFYHRIEGAKGRPPMKNCVIAAETKDEAEVVFRYWADFHSIFYFTINKIKPVIWISRGDWFVNFVYDFEKREITELYVDSGVADPNRNYLLWFWNQNPNDP